MLINDLIERILTDNEVYIVIEKLRQLELATYIKIFVRMPDTKRISGYLDLDEVIFGRFALTDNLNQLCSISIQHNGYFESFVLARDRQLWHNSPNGATRYNFTPVALPYVNDIIDAGKAGIPLTDVGALW